MFSPTKPQQSINSYPETTTTATTMIITGDTTTSSDENTTPQPPPPKKRAETWIKEETLTLITLRHELNPHFNTSKSNKHLWEQISLKMREKGFDRSPTMCTDKWRNLLKEFKKIKEQSNCNNGYSVMGNINTSKMQFYKEVEQVVRDRGNCNSKIDSFLQFSDKGVEDSNIAFGPVEANTRGALNLERELDQEGHPLAISATDTMAASGVSPWNWRETPANGDQNNSYGGRVILVKLGNYTRRIGIDGTPDAIKEAIKSAFRLRTNRAFWLEDVDNIVRTLDRDMPLGNYSLHVDEVAIDSWPRLKNIHNIMDPKYTGEMLRHLEKQDELLMDSYRSMSHELHKLQIEEEMIMRSFYDFMDAQGLIKKKQDGTIALEESKPQQSKALVIVGSKEKE